MTGRVRLRLQATRGGIIPRRVTALSRGHLRGAKEHSLLPRIRRSWGGSRWRLLEVLQVRRASHAMGATRKSRRESEILHLATSHHRMLLMTPVNHGALDWSLYFTLLLQPGPRVDFHALTPSCFVFFQMRFRLKTLRQKCSSDNI